ncbi:MAG: hypothetical protein KJ645_13255 [Planctomycetes bacterium]|nr:hypothetical protein [Planctomycetota bacterium]
MRRKARLADGTRVGLAVCDPVSVSEAVECKRITLGPRSHWPGHQRIDVWSQVHVGLLHDLAGFSLSQAGRKASCNESGAGKMTHRHRALLIEDENYAERVLEVVLEAWRLSGLGRLADGSGGVVELS